MSHQHTTTSELYVNAHVSRNWLHADALGTATSQESTVCFLQFTIICLLLTPSVQNVARQQVCSNEQCVRAKVCRDADNTRGNPLPQANIAKPR